MTTNKIMALAAASSLILAGAMSTASAATPLTASFVGNARANIDFLDSSSRLAIDQSPSSKVRAFAHREAINETIAGNAFVAFSSANPVAVATAPALGPDGGLLGPIGAAVSLPLDVATNVTGDVGDGIGSLLTGRSVAVGNPLAPVTAAPPTIPASVRDLDRLHAAKGRDFDALYRSTQRDALTQLATIYTDYAQNGNDQALRALAIRELPKVRRSLRELNAI